MSYPRPDKTTRERLRELWDLYGLVYVLMLFGAVAIIFGIMTQ